MRILQLNSQNIKKIKAVEIRPKDNVVVISGKNDQGKTSVLDSIFYALAGKDSLKKTPVPIREGEKTAQTRLDLGNYIVTRKWTSNDKSYLEVTGKDGRSYKTPQQLIDSFIGDLSFDPLEFAQMKEKEQRELLLGLINLDIDLAHTDTKIEVLYDQRRQKGQEVKLLQGQREDSEEGLPDKLISIAELQEEYEKALSYNNNIDSIHARLIDYQHLLIDYEKQLEEIQKQIENTKINIKNHEKYLADKVKVDTDPIKQNITNAESINEKIRARERNKEADRKFEKAQAEYDEFTKQIYALADSKKQALNKAKMPIKGLGINVSMAIAVSFNPKLKVVLIRDGSLLDDDNMKIISEMAKGQDLQIWVERVNDQSGMAFIIEDGELKKEEVKQ